MRTSIRKFIPGFLREPLIKGLLYTARFISPHIWNLPRKSISLGTSTETTIHLQNSRVVNTRPYVIHNNKLIEELSLEFLWKYTKSRMKSMLITHLIN